MAEEDDGADAPKKTVLERLTDSVVIAALVAAFSSIVLGYAASGEKRCEIATSFFNDEKDVSIYTEEEWKTVKRAYIRMLRSCR